MDDLPQELVLGAMLTLTHGGMACCKTVCKKWKSLLEDKHVPESWSEVHENEPCVIFRNLFEEWPYFMMLYSWSGSTTYVDLQQFDQCDGIVLASSSSGLLLMADDKGGYLVFNPLTQIAKTLPKQPPFQRPLLQPHGWPNYKFFSEHSSLHYMIAVISRELNELGFENELSFSVYDSEVESWTVCSSTPYALKRDLLSSPLGSSICLITWPLNGSNSFMVVAAYDIHNGIWQDIIVVTPPDMMNLFERHDSDAYEVFVYMGQIFLAMALDEPLSVTPINDQSSLERIYRCLLFQLDKTSLSWKLIWKLKRKPEVCRVHYFGRNTVKVINSSVAFWIDKTMLIIYNLERRTWKDLTKSVRVIIKTIHNDRTDLSLQSMYCPSLVTKP